MIKSLSLTDAEWDLVQELLRHEVDDLRAEIHHTDAAGYREELKARRQTAEELLAKLDATVAL